ncbi:NAD(P)-dependent dehydrogenase (short-subunit alcohol dehydrogenase family) [Humitalea rosea]|uniref:NAD(P)-dependent dehydrogenase (Short-subunit alcohol dehydrogenase family) n=1 Tax=Humitalea rosea TaxID=990373 RepID=A0A2W7IT01_9PROT|nr:SDR family oxidoreductase [Humitalea rosea]PZW50379.1 NAD(P)-dependent dehydrogenase (short-subunit alcohol dehydrogenase family) [Humitalea rosea]
MLLIPPSIPRVALVTGGAQRLGRAIAVALAGAGFDIALHHATTDAEAVAAEIRALGRRVVTLRADLGQEAEVAGLVPAAIAALGPLGVLVNNASTFERDEMADASRASWDRHMEPNLRAPFVLAQAFAAALPPGAEGVVLNMIDQRVWSLTPHFVSYTVSKAGLWTLTQTLALALAPRIRVVAIGPGPAIPSPRQSQAQFDRQCASTPLRRGTSPEEVAGVALALLAMPSVTGQMIALDGGQHLQWSPGTPTAEPEE